MSTRAKKTSKAGKAAPKTPRPPKRPGHPKGKGDGVALDTERGHDIVDRITELCGGLYRRSEIARKVMDEFSISRAQAYRYYDAAWKVIGALCDKSHEEKVKEARHSLAEIAKKCFEQKRYGEMMAAIDRRNLIDKVTNPVSAQKVTVLNGQAAPQVDDNATDEDLLRIQADARRLLEARAGSTGSGPAAAPAKGKK